MCEATNSAAVTIRPAIAADVDGIARAYRESAEYHAGIDPERYLVPPPDVVSALYRDQRNSQAVTERITATFVAEVDGGVAGFVDARLERSPDAMHREIIYCHIAEIAVLRDYRNRGIGSRLMRAAEEWGRERRAQFASLEYHVANVAAGTFYQRRSGYRVAALTVIKRLEHG